MTGETGTASSAYEAIEEPPLAVAGAAFSTDEPIEDPAQAEAGAGSSADEPIDAPAQAGTGADSSALEAILDEMGDGAELEIDSPQFVRLREVCRQIAATLYAGRRSEDDPAQGTPPGLARTDTPLARAENQFRLWQEEQSRQLDAHFGINGERPEAVGQNPDPDGAGRSAGRGAIVPSRGRRE